MTTRHYQKLLDTSAGAQGMIARVKSFLQSETGRQKILYCIKNRIPLTGSPDIPDSGVSQCRLLGRTVVMFTVFFFYQKFFKDCLSLPESVFYY